jgi:catechol 2,3-dioxygenase-like lactoylglutathione lyase family enzyme
MPPDPSRAIPNDVFNENRLGLDHLSFSVGSRQDLVDAVRLFDAEGISHGEIKDLGPAVPVYVLAFRDPDNIQIELTAPHG